MNICALTSWYLIAPKAQKETLQRNVALHQLPLQHRRELLSCHHAIHKFIDNAPERAPIKWRHDIREELMFSNLLLAISEAYLRWPVSTSVTCTDATVSSGATCDAFVSNHLAQSLYQSSEYRGKYVRIKGSQAVTPDAEESSGLAKEICESLGWEQTSITKHRHASHINLQEAREIASVIKHQSRLTLLPSRHVNFSDSNVGLCSWAKGRSSSLHLNRIYRPLIGWQVMAQTLLVNLKVASDDNPADDGDRGRPLRAPKPAPVWLSPLAVPEVCVQLRGLLQVLQP